MIFIFDTVTLINLTKRTQLKPLLEIMIECGETIHIVNHVYDEFCKRNESKNYINLLLSNCQINLIDLDDNEDIAYEYADYIKDDSHLYYSLGDGELFAYLYAIQLSKQKKDFKLFTDDGAAQNMINAKKQLKAYWTKDLIQDFIDQRLLTLEEGELYYSEMLKNGFRGDINHRFRDVT